MYCFVVTVFGDLLIRVVNSSMFVNRVGVKIYTIWNVIECHLMYKLNNPMSIKGNIISEAQLGKIFLRKRNGKIWVQWPLKSKSYQ